MKMMPNRVKVLPPGSRGVSSQRGRIDVYEEHENGRNYLGMETEPFKDKSNVVKNSYLNSDMQSGLISGGVVYNFDH